MKHAEGKYAMKGMSASENGRTVSCARRVSMVRRTWSMVHPVSLLKQGGARMWSRTCVFGEKLGGGVGGAIVNTGRSERGACRDGEKDVRAHDVRELTILGVCEMRDTE